MNYHDVKISDDVIVAVDAGRKIDAIKILREQTGLGLADAKHQVDSLARERRDHPGAVPAVDVMEEEGGAAGMIRMVVIIGLILGAYFYFVAG